MPGLIAVSLSLMFAGTSCGAKTGLDVGADGPCVRLDAVAERAELDVFVMLDTSGSMDFETAEGITKARAVRNALAEFLSDPDSAGLGVSLSFFPILRPEVPSSCLTDEDCGEPGACRGYSRACVPSGERECETDVDCEGTGDGNDICAELGGCANDPQTLCLREYPASSYCDSDVSCLKLGACTNDASCDPAPYSAPVVDVSTLPQARSALLLALDTRESAGSTPTLPALIGALSAARAEQESRPGHKAIVVLATDGFPSTCDPAIDPDLVQRSPQGIDKLVVAAEEAAQDGVQAFVVGVFAPEEEEFARTNLGRIAEAGATERAFIVTTDEPVSERLVDTLVAIRRGARACEFAIPWPGGGGHDPETLRVELTTAGSPARVARVEDASACDPLSGGFYFDRTPAPGVAPHRVILCPTTCAPFGVDSAPRLEVLADCEAHAAR